MADANEVHPGCVVLYPQGHEFGPAIVQRFGEAGIVARSVTTRRGCVDAGTPAGSESFDVDPWRDDDLSALAGGLRSTGIDTVVVVTAESEPIDFLSLSGEAARARMQEPCVRFFNLVRHLVPVFAVRGGSIVNVIEVAGSRGARPGAAGSMARGVVWQLTRSLAVELAAVKIRVNAVVAGPTAEASHTAAVRRVPLRRVCEADDVGSASVFLASPANAGYVTGVFLPLDGGNGAKL